MREQLVVVTQYRSRIGDENRECQKMTTICLANRNVHARKMANRNPHALRITYRMVTRCVHACQNAHGCVHMSTGTHSMNVGARQTI